MNTETPNDKWTLKQLAKFCVLTLRRTATDAWHIGHALSIARDKQKDERNWLRWLAEEVGGMSKSSAYRYMDIFKKQSLNDVQGRTLGEVYEALAPAEEPSAESEPRATLVNAQPATPAQPVSQVSNDNGTAASPAVPHRPGESQFSWAVPDPAAEDSFTSVITACDQLAESLSSAIEHHDWTEWNAKQRAKLVGKTSLLRDLLTQLERPLAQKASA